MVLFENLRIAIQALRANAMRSLLTTLGIFIGVAAVIAVVSIVQGLQHMLSGQFQEVGATFVIVLPDQQNQGPGVVSRQVKLTWEDGQALERDVPQIAEITPLILGNETAKYRERKHQTLVFGVNENWSDVNNHAVDRGRFFSHIDLSHRRKVAVVGEKVVEELRLGSQPIGKDIYVGGLPVTVIGVMEEKGRSLGTDIDDLLFIPFETALGVFGRRAGDQVQLRLQVDPSASMELAKENIRRVLRARHKITQDQPDDFQILVQDELLKSFSSALNMVTAVVGGIVSVALLVAGIGIMNIMLVSVTERTREIGLRKAVGARKKDILVQFLIEAVTLSLIGGALGVAGGYAIGAGVAKVLPGDWPPAHVPVWAVLLGFGFSAFVGVFFGIYPAGKAAKLDPIEALRYE